MKSRLLYILLFALGLNYSVSAQLNEYKYIIVPKKFGSFKSENQYQTSTLVKHFLSENGFTAVYDDALPADLAANRCLGLVADLLDASSMFSTKLHLTLKNCQNVEVFRTVEGKSKIKDFDSAYKEALERAFVSFSNMNYQYEPKKQDVVSQEKPVTISFKDDVKSLEEKPKEYVVEHKATLEEQTYKSVEPRPSTIQRPTNVSESQTQLPSGVLYAQPIANGYQLVDSTPKIVLKLGETSMENVFLTEYAGNSAVVFKKDEKWVLEYSENGEKKMMELNIKF
ncbi:hypothetical protein SAMN04487891_106171 [Flagellimonas taeanensis]|uniref:Uncharacterized protein n=1 Tax=Flagellimonas taeanensis TaxID=1005926 RepID=A0A1M6YTM4_9FLAO|nr:hypothetical protein [Allomuricauda taeanensis]MEE1963799.1 hypothetical protein [Allomuricauda taeanensis]SFC14248.1 hypothetical protein SAMN04487891_106171 [Allomuricauda taeanensis]SHL21671.1 hypothetical protein SAMN05216293_2947 [Allomuricauda taeanensis]